jgi:glycine/D-amino acid oxidase-like deaminating enzyme
LGASAVSLAFGTATMSAKGYSIFFDPTSDEGHCAVLGAGVVGIMTALELIKRGRKVTIYAEAIPDSDPKEGAEVTSQCLPIVWMPKEYDWSEDMLKHELVSKLSYEYLRESL